ncbi:unnamed protein product [Haemonchus placei]|uniref:Ephrin RBD domain-containing protein n=1 Tax=Haemonchus placei TaxID=6290 RepID=A0A0N4WPN8_HAEPC|nr:unnamed protein product [Haemonchus placei]
MVQYFSLITIALLVLCSVILNVDASLMHEWRRVFWVNAYSDDYMHLSSTC